MSNLDVHLKETIDLVHSLFLVRRNSKPENSARYYAIYTLLGCGSSFTSVHEKLRKTFNLTGFRGRRDLENGRASLIEDGMLAKILFYHKTDMEDMKGARIFRGEQYLPVNPRLIYDDISQDLGSQYNLLDGDYELLDQLYKSWKKNFREHGFLIEKGILGIYCTAPWLLFNLLNYLSIWKGKERTLYFVTSSTNWCRPPLFSPLISTLERGLELRALLDASRKTRELDNLRQMEQVEIRHISKEEIITNRLSLAGNKYVVDVHKILGTESKYSGYVSTIYLGMEDIANQFRASFEARWEHASSY